MSRKLSDVTYMQTCPDMATANKMLLGGWMLLDIISTKDSPELTFLMGTTHPRWALRTMEE